MSMTNWIAFDAGAKTRDHLFAVADRLMRSHGFDLFQVGDLVESNGELDLGKMELPAFELPSALKTAESWTGVFLSYRAAKMGGNFHIYSWRQATTNGFGLEIPHYALLYGDPPGLWLQDFLCELCAALDVRFCVYSADQEVLTTPTVDDLLSRLRSGNTFRFLLIAKDMLDAPRRLEQFQTLCAQAGMISSQVDEKFYAWSRLIS